MATGKTPFAGGSTAEVFAALLRENPPPVSTLNPAMPKRLDPIVAKLLAKDPAQRYATAEQLQEALERLDPQSGKATVASGAGESGPGRSPPVILLALLAGGLTWWKFHPATTPPAGESAAGVAPKAAKDSIILADFINRTGDPVFDTTLNQALQIELEQSPVINIVSQQHLAQSVKYLGRPEGTTVTPEIAREIGVREESRLSLPAPSPTWASSMWLRYAQNTATGDEIVSEQAQAQDKEHVLDALGKAAAAIAAS